MRWLERWRGRREAADGSLVQLPQPMDLRGVRRALAFAPHPDDEAIGCGGALALLADAGVAVRVVLVTDGSGAGALPPGASAARLQEFRASLQVLGVRDHASLGFPDGGLERDPPLRQAVAKQVTDFAPDWVFAPSEVDLHRDHRVVFEAAREAAANSASVRQLWQYEIWGTVTATHVLDITGVLERKLAALACHHTALAAVSGYAEAVAGLGRYRALLLPSPSAGRAAEAYRASGRASGFR